MKYSISNGIASGLHLQHVGQACLQRVASFVGACGTRPARGGRCAAAQSARPTRSEIFRQVQREKWLGAKPTPPQPRYGDLYKRPLLDPSAAMAPRPARSDRSGRSTL